MKHNAYIPFSLRAPWLLLYSFEQRAYHIETRQEYDSKPHNGYYILRVARTYEEAAKMLREYWDV